MTLGSTLSLWNQYTHAESNMLLERTCLMVDYQSCNRALDKAKPNRKEAVSTYAFLFIYYFYIWCRFRLCIVTPQMFTLFLDYVENERGYCCCCCCPAFTGMCLWNASMYHIMECLLGFVFHDTLPFSLWCVRVISVSSQYCHYIVH